MINEHKLNLINTNNNKMESFEIQKNNPEQKDNEENIPLHNQNQKDKKPQSLLKKLLIKCIQRYLMASVFISMLHINLYYMLKVKYIYNKN